MLGKDNKKLTPEESRQLKEKFKNRINALSDEDLSMIAGGSGSSNFSSAEMFGFRSFKDGNGNICWKCLKCSKTFIDSVGVGYSMMTHYLFDCD